MNKHGKHGQFAVWDTASKIWRLLFLLTVFIVPLSGNQASATTYDDFSSGSVQTYKWQVIDANGFLSVVPGSFQPYVLHLSGNGSTGFPKGSLMSKRPFGGDLLAGINFFNFSSSGYTPDPSDPSNPSVWIRFIGGPSDHSFLVSRAYNSSGHGIGCIELDSNGVLVTRSGVPYPSTSGALVVSYTGNQLSLGYSASTNPDQWSDSFQTLITFPITLTANPTLQVGLAAGGGGSVSADVGGLYYWSSEGSIPGTPKWTYATMGGIYSSPAIGNDGTIYVEAMREGSGVYAINPDGTPKWSYITNGGNSSPAIGADGTIYVGSQDYNLYAINPDGTLKWTYATGGRINTFPAIGTDSIVYVASQDNNLYAINPDGTLKWYYPTEYPINSSPTIWVDGTIYVGSNDGNLYAINPDGTLKWFYVIEYAVVSPPSIGADGTIYVGAVAEEAGYLYAINPDGTLKWYYPAGGGIAASPSIGADGTIYVGSQDYNLYAINPDGTLKWYYPTGGWIYSSSAAIGADGTIYVGSQDYNLYAINPDGTLKWSYATRARIQSSPTIGADGAIYFGSFDWNLYALYDEPSVSKSYDSSFANPDSHYSSPTSVARSPWPMFRHDRRHTGNYSGLCTYTVSPANKSLSYKGGTITLKVKAEGYASCPPPEITNNTDWIGYTISTFKKNKGSIKLTVPLYGYASGREGTVNVAENMVTITQKGAPCKFSFSPTSSELFQASGGTGTFTMAATPTDCTWTTLVDEKYASWITIDSGATGTGNGPIGYTVALNSTGKARAGKITVTVGKKTKSYKVKQGNN